MTIVILQTWQMFKKIERSSRQLVTQDLILYEHIQNIRNLLNQQQLAFYQYYLNGSAPDFQQNYQNNKEKLLSELEPVEAVLVESTTVAKIHENINQLENVVAEFVITMEPPTDWDQARVILADYEPVAHQLDQLSLHLTHQLSQRLMQNARFSLEETESGVVWIRVMSLMLLLSIIALLVLNKRLLKALVHQRRLASFPELNPFPVMAISESEQISYANPKALTVTRDLFGDEKPIQLLPTALHSFLKQAKSRKTNIQIEYKVKEQVYTANAQWISELKEYHLYLANITLQHQAREKLQHMAFHHLISGLPNRQALMNIFDVNRPGYLMLLEINRFTDIITSNGHGLGETIIKLTAKRLHRAVESTGTKLFHLESNLFAVSFHDSAIPTALVSNIFNAFSKPVAVADRYFYLNFTIGGVAVESEHDLFEVMRKADSALHSVINHFGNHFRAYDDELDNVLLRRMTLENNLRHAIAQQELMVYYQPIIDGRSGKIASAEALMRWHCAGTEWISPVEFIPIAESSGLINELGKWLIDQIFGYVASNNKRHNESLTIAINISAVQWQDESLVEFFMDKLRHYDLTADNFTLEITEQVALQDIERTVTMMNALKAMGFKVAIDDFGTGYSSLNYLHGLPVDAIKIDKSFISSLTLNNKNSTIVEMLISLAHQLHLKVVAEGVETEEQYQQLLGWDCDYIQGYLFSRPLDKGAFERYSTQYG